MRWIVVIGLSAILWLQMELAQADDYVSSTVAELQLSPVFVSPAIDDLNEQAQQRLETRAKQGLKPDDYLYIAVMSTRAQREITDPAAFARQVRQAFGSVVVLVVLGDRFEADAAGIMTTSQAHQLAQQAARNHPGDVPAGIETFIDSVHMQAAASRDPGPALLAWSVLGGIGLSVLLVAVWVWRLYKRPTTTTAAMPMPAAAPIPIPAPAPTPVSMPSSSGPTTVFTPNWPTGPRYTQVKPLEDGDPKVVGPYQISGVIARGGMGFVYLGYAEDGLKAAVKVVFNRMDRDYVLRFQREIDAVRAVSKRQCPNTVRYLNDYDRQGDVLWLATEFIDGPTLHQRMQERPMSDQEVWLLGLHVAQALVVIHQLELTHRDLKPLNVLWNQRQQQWQVIDFGIVHQAEETRITGHYHVVMTYLFAAPEQILNGKITAASDIFALGNLLYFASTGVEAFGADEVVGVVCHRILDMEPDLSKVKDPKMQQLIKQCLAKQPDKRPTAEEVRQKCLKWLKALG